MDILLVDTCTGMEGHHRALPFMTGISELLPTQLETNTLGPVFPCGPVFLRNHSTSVMCHPYFYVGQSGHWYDHPASLDALFKPARSDFTYDCRLMQVVLDKNTCPSIEVRHYYDMQQHDVLCIGSGSHGRQNGGPPIFQS